MFKYSALRSAFAVSIKLLQPSKAIKQSYRKWVPQSNRIQSQQQQRQQRQQPSNYVTRSQRRHQLQLEKTSIVEPQPFHSNDECGCCKEPLGCLSPLVYCKRSCGNRFHAAACIGFWSLCCFKNQWDFICPACRAAWIA